MTEEDWDPDAALIGGVGMRAALDMLGLQNIGVDEVWKVGSRMPARDTGNTNPILFFAFQNGQEVRFQTSDGIVPIPDRNTVTWLEWGTWHRDGS